MSKLYYVDQVESLPCLQGVDGFHNSGGSDLTDQLPQENQEVLDELAGLLVGQASETQTKDSLHVRLNNRATVYM